MNRSANATPRLSGWAKCQLLRARARGAGGGPTGRRRSTCCSEPLPRREGRTRCSQPVRTACHQALRGWGGSLNVTQLEQGDGLETKGSVNTHTNLVHTRTGTQAHTCIHTRTHTHFFFFSLWTRIIVISSLYLWSPPASSQFFSFIEKLLQSIFYSQCLHSLQSHSLLNALHSGFSIIALLKLYSPRPPMNSTLLNLVVSF